MPSPTPTHDAPQPSLAAPQPRRDEPPASATADDESGLSWAQLAGIAEYQSWLRHLG